MDFWNYLAQLVGYLAMIVVAILIIGLIISAWREAYQKSDTYKRRRSRKHIKREMERVRDMHNSGMISGQEAAVRLDRLSRGDGHV